MKWEKIKISGSTIVSRGVALSLIWWILTDGTAASWWIGVPAVLLAATVSAALIPPVPLVWSELLRFVSFFLLHSLLGGVDVARRALSPKMPIDPYLIAYPLRLPPGLPRIFMINTVSLLPGTLSAALDQDVLSVHVLNRHKDVLAELEMLEKKVARIFNIPLNNSTKGE